MVFVTIENLVTFAPNIGVLVEREAVNEPPEKLAEAVRIAFSHMEDQPLVDACCGGCGPLADMGQISYETYLDLLRKCEIQQAAERAKKDHTRQRRAEFNSRRSDLVLKMIEAGVPYICAVSDCGVHEELTVDHIVPLSRGGTDDLENLQFLCQSHNSAKGDRKDA